jgi:hypothetical protein
VSPGEITEADFCSAISSSGPFLLGTFASQWARALLAQPR